MVKLATACAISVAMGLFSAGSACGQSPVGTSSPAEIFAASPLEDYVRALDELGRTAPAVWSVRALGPKHIGAMAGSATCTRGGWQSRVCDSTTGAAIRFIPPTISLRFNSTIAYGTQDGAIWAGRGLTSAVQMGLEWRAGPMTLTMAPLMFRAENTSLPLPQDSLLRSYPALADFGYPFKIDLPRRFGTTPYQRLDPGQSTIRFDALHLAIGASTGNEAWGPARRFNYILSTEAAGIPRLFAGTAAPVSTPLGGVHFRLLWGQLQQSSWSLAPDSFRLRLASGGIAVWQPRGFTGSEVGAARFYHERWPVGGLRHAQLSRVFQGLYKVGLAPDSDGVRGERLASNQLASLFARIRVAPAGVEVYGEWGRDDHSYDLRDMLQEPEHLGSIMLGIARTWPSSRGIRQFGAEWIDYTIGTSSLYRPEGATYLHGQFLQGHTQRGQPLGAAAGVASGSGLHLNYDNYNAAGRLRVEVSRILRYDAAAYWEGARHAQSRDVLYAIGMNRLTFHRQFDATLGIVALLDLNRELTRDAAGINLTVSVQPH